MPHVQTSSSYQQTPIGAIPSEWLYEKLDLHSKRGSGHTPSKRFPEYYNGNIVWVSLADSPNLDNGLISKSRITISEQGILNSSTVMHPKGTVLMSRDAGIGKSAVAGCELCVSQHFITWTCKEKTLHNWFLYYWLQFRKQEFERIAIGSTIKTIGLPFFKEYKIPLPSYNEQTAIAAALSDADTFVSDLEQLIAKKRNIKQGAVQRLYTPREGWEVKKLGEIGKCIRGVSYNGERDLYPHDTDHTVRLLRSNNVQNEKIELSELQFVDHSRVKPIQYLQENDIVICMANGSKQLVGKSAVFKINNWRYAFGAFMGCFRVYSEYAYREFMPFIFQTHQYRSFIEVLLSGSSINNLKPSDIESVEVPLPPISEQKAIVLTLRDMDAEIEALEQKLEKYKMLKQGMMQNLLTGKIRLV